MAEISETMGLRADIASVLEKWERTMLEDGKIDLAESAVLLAYAKTQVDRNTKFADFVKLLENVREDGVITPEESEQIVQMLGSLVRPWYRAHAPATEPESGLLGRLFKLKRNATTVKTELAAGLTTFMTMAYILAVNPNILATAGIPRGGVFVATALAAVLGTLLMAFMSNYPFVLAPGMGLNAFLTYGVVVGMGYSWQFALLAVFAEGLVFLALSLTPVREAIFNCIPFTLKKAVAAGIGLFICFIALQTAKVIVDNPATLVSLLSFHDAPFHTQGVCATLAIAGTILTGVMMARHVRGAILFGIFATWGLGMLAQGTGGK